MIITRQMCCQGGGALGYIGFVCSVLSLLSHDHVAKHGSTALVQPFAFLLFLSVLIFLLFS